MLSSLVFYGWGEPKYVVLMIASIVIGYFSGILIEAFSEKKLSKLFLGLSVVVDLGFLAYFKYADFFISNFNAATGLSVPLLRIALPVGISFYTFQALSYSIDVYRKKIEPTKDIVAFFAPTSTIVSTFFSNDASIRGKALFISMSAYPR